MLDIYNKYKLKYNDYIILIKCGGFYIALNDDAFVMNKLFKFKIIEMPTFVKVGFPINSLSKIIEIIDISCINYVVIDNDIVMLNEYKNNKYNSYKMAYNYKIYYDRINRISYLLKINITKENIVNILDEMDNILCKII